ncbi:MAG: phosphoenolpyruvate carboxykinase domain-containing protein, partial [Parachlamydiaceae bacterium]
DKEDNGKKTAIGILPEKIDLTGLDIDINSILSVDKSEWKKEIENQENYFKIFDGYFPKELQAELQGIRERLSS